MASIISLTSLQIDSLIQVKIRAQNSIGWGDYSQLNTVGPTIQSTPAQMNTPLIDYTQSNNTELYVFWSALTGVAKGGSTLSINGYDLFVYDSVILDYVLVTTTTNTYYLDGSLTGGTSYTYKVRANNIYGSGPNSTTVTGFTA